MESNFAIGDRVFAKMRGHPPWPAKILELSDESLNKTKYRVFFYGTGDTGEVKPTDICSYVLNKAKLGKEKKRKKALFALSIQEIEDDLSVREKEILLELENNDENDLERLQNETTDSDITSKPRRGRKRKSESNIVKSKMRKSEDNSNSEHPRSSSRRNVNEENTNVTKPVRNYEDFIFSSEDDVDEASYIELSKDNYGNECIVAYVKNKEIKIPLTLNRPNFDKALYKFIWAVKMKLFACHLKKLLESGQISVLSARKQMEKWSKKHTDLEMYSNVLKTELKLMKINLGIRNALSEDTNDVTTTMKLLNELYDLDITVLMLKKNFDVVLTIDKVRKYTGPLSLDKEIEQLQETEELRLKADHIFTQFQSFFVEPSQSQTFWKEFKRQVRNYLIAVKHLNDEELTVLVDDPVEFMKEI